MDANRTMTLRRACEAILIPSGERLTLAAGSQVLIRQALGGTYTVITNNGALARIGHKDADALGLTGEIAPSAHAATARQPEEIESLVWDQLRTCFDPEIPVNIVDLGLVYHCQVLPLSEDGNKVVVKFTLTAPGCGMGDILKMDIEDKLSDLSGVTDADVEVVFDPPWTQDMMTEAAKLELGLL